MDDEALFEAVVKELERSGPKKGLWAKAFATADGNENAAKAYYLKWRATQINEEHVQILAAQRETEVREAAEAGAKERERQAAAALRHRLRPFALKLRSLGLPIDTVVMQLEFKGLAHLDATQLAMDIFHFEQGS